jgi:putative modified peptide
MSNDSSQDSPHTPFPLDVAERLLALMSQNDEFRAKFVADPRAALIQVGLDPLLAEVAAEQACTSIKELAPKEEIARGREVILRHMREVEPHRPPPYFEAGTTDLLSLKD